MRFFTALTFAIATSLVWSAPQSQNSGEAVEQEPPRTTYQVKDEKHQEDLNNDNKIGADVAKLVEAELEFSENQEYIDRVNDIGLRLAKIANEHQVDVSWGDERLSPFDYQFFVLKGDDINAFSVPGGYIYVYEGLIEFAETDDELAGVIAHEIAHASFRHIATLNNERKKINWVNIAAVLIAITSPENAMNVLLPAQLVTLGMSSGWSVKAEKAADFGGLQYLMISDYNSLGALTFMERLAYTNRFQPDWDLGIYTTHPPSDERAEMMTTFLKENEVAFRRSQVTTSLSASWETVDNGYQVSFGEYSIHTFAGDNAQDRADRAVVRLNTFFDAMPALFEVKIRSENLIYGRRRMLFSVEQPDATNVDISIEEGTQNALESMKRVLFHLGFRIQIWKSILKADSDQF